MPRILANLDMYRKVPQDLLEGSRRGSIISWMALVIMAYLVFCETSAYFSSKLVTDLSLDRSSDKKIRVRFNITMMDLACEFATIDVFSFLGKQQNVTSRIQKFALDGNGVQQNFVKNRNPMQHDIDLHDERVTKTLEELHDDGEHAVPLTPETFEFAKNENQFLFVDFYAGWCVHCQVFAPTWETLAEIMDDAAEEKVKHLADYSDEEYEQAKNLERPVFIGKVDCVAHHQFCGEQGVTGYPTVRLYVNQRAYGDYWGHRTINNLMQFVKLAEESINAETKLTQAHEIAARLLNITDEERQWADSVERRRHQAAKSWDANKHPGCQISGILLLDRTPGNFYIQAQSPNHDLSPYTTNVSHIVHELSFADEGKEGKQLQHNYASIAPPNFAASTRSMDGNVYVTQNLHEAYHHYLKLVSTNLYAYQILQSSQLALYKEDQVPEAKFIIDLSPIQVSYSRWTRRWYDYITSLMAILGGTFTVVGMLESGLRVAGRKLSHHRPAHSHKT